MPDVERYLNCVLRLCEPCRRSPGCGRESPQGAEGLCAHRRRPALGGERCEEKVRKVPAERGEAAARRGEWRNFAPTVVFFFFPDIRRRNESLPRRTRTPARVSLRARRAAQRGAGPGRWRAARRHRGAPWVGGGMAAGCCLRGGGERVLRDLPLKMAWRPLLGGCGGSSPAPQALRRFKMLFFKHHFYSSPSMWSLGRRRGTDSLFSPPGVPPARSRSRGMRWGSALLYVRGRERPCRTGAAALPLCPPGGDRAAVAIRVLGW